MNAEARKRIKLNRHLRASPGRKRAYRVAKWRGDMDGVLRALYSGQMRVVSPHPMWRAKIMLLEPKADAYRPWLDGGSGPR